MDNTDLYTSYYTSNNKTLLLYPISGTFINLNSYLISFNEIKDTDGLKTILEYYAYQQLDAFKLKNNALFEKVKYQIDMLIDRDWKNSDKHKEFLTTQYIEFDNSTTRIISIDKNIAPFNKNKPIIKSNIKHANRNYTNITNTLNNKEIWGVRQYRQDSNILSFLTMDKYSEFSLLTQNIYDKLKYLDILNKWILGHHLNTNNSIVNKDLLAYTRLYENNISILNSVIVDKLKLSYLLTDVCLSNNQFRNSILFNNTTQFTRKLYETTLLNQVVFINNVIRQLVINNGLFFNELNVLSNEFVKSTLFAVSFPIKDIIISKYNQLNKLKPIELSNLILTDTYVKEILKHNNLEIVTKELTKQLDQYSKLYFSNINTKEIYKKVNTILATVNYNEFVYLNNILAIRCFNDFINFDIGTFTSSNLRDSYLNEFKNWIDEKLVGTGRYLPIYFWDKLYKPGHIKFNYTMDKLKDSYISKKVWYDHSINKEFIIAKNLMGQIKNKEFQLLNVLVDFTYGLIEAKLNKDHLIMVSNSTDSKIVKSRSLKLFEKAINEISTVLSLVTMDLTKLNISKDAKLRWSGILEKDSFLTDHIYKLDRVIEHDSIINKHTFLTTKDKLNAYKQNKTQVIAENETERKIRVDINEPSGVRRECSITVPDKYVLTTKELKDLYIKEKYELATKSDKDMLIEEKHDWGTKSDKDMLIEEKHDWGTKSDKDMLIEEKHDWVTKNNKQVLVIDNSRLLERLESAITIDSISYWIEKTPAHIDVGNLYVLMENTGKQIYIKLQDNIPMEVGYKTIEVLNSLVSFTKELNKIELSNVSIFDKKEKELSGLSSKEIPVDKIEKSVFGLLSNTENFEKVANNVILNIRDAQLLLDKNPKDIILNNDKILADIDKRWYFIPDNGPYDPIILPLDYPYSEHPINGVVTTESDLLPYPFTAKDIRTLTYEHPIPNGSDKAQVEIKVSIYIMANVIDFCFYLLDAYKDLYSRYTPSQALKHFVNLIFNWLDGQIPDVAYKLPEFYEVNYEVLVMYETYREDYWRLYRWIRWYAESIIQNIPDVDLNTLKGVEYVNILINELVKYFNDHHGIYSRLPGRKVLDKVKGARHVWLSRYKNKF